MVFADLKIDDEESDMYTRTSVCVKLMISIKEASDTISAPLSLG